MPALPVTGTDGRVYMAQNKGAYSSLKNPDLAEMKTDSSQKMLGGGSSLTTIYQSMRPKRSRVQSANTYKRNAQYNTQGATLTTPQIELSNTELNLLQSQADKQKRFTGGAGFTSDPRS